MVTMGVAVRALLAAVSPSNSPHVAFNHATTTPTRIRAGAGARVWGGIINPTAAPYFADPTGKVDATRALQAALRDARNGSRTVMLPHGVYRVLGTLNITATSEFDAIG